MKWRRACIACNAFFDLGSVRPRRSPLHLEFGNIDRSAESLDLIEREGGTDCHGRGDLPLLSNHRAPIRISKW